MKMKRLMDTGFAVDEVSSAIDAAGGAKALSLKTKGTTNAGIIGNGEMYISGDGRKVELDNGLMQITSSTELKYDVLYEGIICSLAGTNEIFQVLVRETQESQKKYRGLEEERMLAIKNKLESFRNEWQIKHPGELFECELMVFGLMRGVQTILHMQEDMILEVQDVNSYVVSKFGRGNDPRAPGGFQANAHIMNALSVGNTFSRTEYLRILQQAITIAGLHSQYTGGFIWGRVIGVTPENRFGFLERVGFRCHTLRSLGQYFGVIDGAGHLDHCLLCVTSDLRYSAFSEAAFAYDIRQRFQPLTSLVLGGCLKGDDGDGDHVTVRLLRFADDTSRDQAYYSLPLVRPEGAGDDEEQPIHHASKFNFNEPGREKVEYRMCFFLPSLVNLCSILQSWEPFDY